MPFDGTETPAMRRSILIDALRNDTAWEWDFCDTAGCAIGMAKRIWPQADAAVPVYLLDITNCQYLDIFGYINLGNNIDRGLPHEWSDFYGMERTEVTPQMVADALEKLG